MTSWPGDDEHWSIGEPEKPAGDGTHEHPSNRPRARPADDDAPGAEHLCHPEQLVGRVSVAKEKGPRHTGSGQEEFDHHLAGPGDLLHSIVVVGRLDRTRLDSRLTLERLSAGELWPELAHFRLAPKILVLLILTTTAFIIKKRRDAHRLAEPAKVKADARARGNLEASLGAYADAGRKGILDTEIVERIIRDLDEVEASADAGDTVELLFAPFEPLFSVVIGHTEALARAYSVVLPNVENEDSESDAAVVVHVRRHLVVQKRILGESA